MLFKARRFVTAALVLSLLIQMHMAENGFASRRTKIAFTSTRDGNAEIYVMDGDGRNQKRLTVDPTVDRDPAWSPDGTKIAFVSNRNKGYIQIWVIDADGENPIRLTDGVWDRNPDWSPDGSRIAYYTNDHIGVMDSNGENQRRLTKNGWHEHPTWSPDGGSIAFHSWDRDRREFGIFTVGVIGGAVNLISHVPGFADYEPDWLYPGELSVSPAGNPITIWGRLKQLASDLR